MAKRLWDTIVARFHDDNAEWGLSHRTALLLFAAPFVLILVTLASIPVPGAFRVLANEDGIAEWGQFTFLVVLVPIYARFSRSLWRQGQRPLALLYVLATLAVFFAAGEEISWGQRIFGWLTPETLEDINNQGETNIHNIGPLLTVFNLVVMTVAFTAAALPVVRWSVWRDRARSIAGYALIPPAVLIPAFGMEFSYRAVRILFLPTPRFALTRLAEIGELSFYFGLLMFGLISWRVIVDGWRPSAPGVMTDGALSADPFPSTGSPTTPDP